MVHSTRDHIYRMAAFHIKRNSTNSTKVKQEKGNKGKNQTWILTPSQGSFHGITLPLRRSKTGERMSDSQRHSISYHSVNLIIQEMMECKTWQTDARVVSWVWCKTPSCPNALQCVWLSSGRAVGLHGKVGCGQTGRISLLGRHSDLLVWDVLLCSSPAVRTGDAPEGGTRVSEDDNLEQSPLKTCNATKAEN